MADGYDSYDKPLDYREGGGGGSFVMGLLTGTVLGAGLGMLFAPKAGTDLRNQLSEQAGNMANQASEGYRRASQSAGEWAEKGRDVYNKASEVVAKGAEEAQKYVKETASSAGSTYGSSPTYSSSPESLRGSAADSDATGARITGAPGSTGSRRS